MPRGFRWSEAMDSRLRELTKDHSFSEISAILWQEFEIDVSRNACIGRASRIGLVKRRVEKIRRIRERPQEIAKSRDRILSIKKSAPEFFAEEIVEERVADATPRHVSLLELKIGECRYPYGEGPFTFCGCETSSGQTYCEPHHDLCEREHRSCRPEERARHSQHMRRILAKKILEAA